MKQILKTFALLVYWGLSLDMIQWLINYPQDVTFYLALLWFVLNIYITYYLIKNKKLK